MCRSEAEGGRRCKSQEGERRRAYQRGLGAMNAALEEFDASFTRADPDTGSTTAAADPVDTTVSAEPAPAEPVDTTVSEEPAPVNAGPALVNAEPALVPGVDFPDPEEKAPAAMSRDERAKLQEYLDSERPVLLAEQAEARKVLDEDPRVDEVEAWHKARLREFEEAVEAGYTSRKKWAAETGAELAEKPEPDDPDRDFNDEHQNHFLNDTPMATIRGTIAQRREFVDATRKVGRNAELAAEAQVADAMADYDEEHAGDVDTMGSVFRYKGMEGHARLADEGVTHNEFMHAWKLKTRGEGRQERDRLLDAVDPERERVEEFKRTGLTKMKAENAVFDEEFDVFREVADSTHADDVKARQARAEYHEEVTRKAFLAAAGADGSAAWTGDLSEAQPQAAARLRESMECYPQALVDHVAEKIPGLLPMETDGEGGQFNPSRNEVIYGRDVGDAYRRSVAAHEFGHVAQKADPVLIAAEHQFLCDRTQGCASNVGTAPAGANGGAADYVSYGDGFESEYTSRIYDADGATEVFSTGMEYLAVGWSKDVKCARIGGWRPRVDDADHRRFTLGYLAHWS